MTNILWTLATTCCYEKSKKKNAHRPSCCSQSWHLSDLRCIEIILKLVKEKCNLFHKPRKNWESYSESSEAWIIDRAYKQPWCHLQFIATGTWWKKKLFLFLDDNSNKSAILDANTYQVFLVYTNNSKRHSCWIQHWTQYVENSFYF